MVNRLSPSSNHTVTDAEDDLEDKPDGPACPRMLRLLKDCPPQWYVLANGAKVMLTVIVDVCTISLSSVSPCTLWIILTHARTRFLVTSAPLMPFTVNLTVCLSIRTAFEYNLQN